MAGEDPEYLRWLALRMCALATHCGQRSGHPHHARHDKHGPVGVGQRAHDSRAIPLCPQHHVDFHDGHGVFAAMTPAERRAWMDDQIERHNRIYAEELVPGEVPF